MCRTFNFISPTKNLPKRNIIRLIPPFEQTGMSFDQHFSTVD